MYKIFKRATDYEWYNTLFKRGKSYSTILIIEEAEKLSEENIIKIKEDIKEFSESIWETRKSYREEYKECIKKLEEICSDCDVSYKNHKGTHDRWFKSLLVRFKPTGSYPGNFGDISCSYVEYKGELISLKDIEYYCHGSSQSIRKIIETLHELIKLTIETIEKKEKKKNHNNLLLRKAIEIAINRGMDYSNIDDKELIKKITDIEIEKHTKLQDGNTITFKQCDECDEWTVGERRCSCGNRRVYLGVEGNIVDGFYSYPEVY